METLDQARIANLEAHEAATLIAIATLLQMHPAQTALHLRLTQMAELTLAPSGALGRLLDEAQRDSAREVIEWLGALQPRPDQSGQ